MSAIVASTHRRRTKFDAKYGSVEEKRTLSNRGGTKLFLSLKSFALSYFLVRLRMNYKKKKKSVLKIYFFLFICIIFSLQRIFTLFFK